MSTPFFSYQPIISKQGKVIANRLSIHVGGQSDPMVAAVHALQEVEEYWPMGQSSAVFLRLEGAPPGPALFDWMLPENLTLELPAAALSSVDAPDLIAAVKSSSPGTCLDFDLQAVQALQCGLSFRFLALDAQTLSAQQMQAIAIKLKPIVGIALAFNIDTVPTFKALMDAGMAGGSGWFCKRPSGATGKELAPSQAHIVQVLNLVRNNADISQIETALKQDIALSYRLLRYINSAGFGLSCEVQSFRHAVTILGYDKLNKWLSLLLVSSSKDPMAPAMMHSALARARLMELLGQGTVGKSELDNLFIVGAFSLLDAMLGIPLEKALEPMHLPEPITDTLLQQRGPYAAIFKLVLAIEDGDGPTISAAAEDVGLAAHQVNSALLQSFSFAANLSF